MKTTKQRLAAAKALTEKLAGNYPQSSHYANWRNNVERPFKRTPAAGRWAADYTGHKSGRPFYVDSLDATGWRQTGDAADILRAAGAWRAADNCNWYADNYQGEVIKSAVLQLPSRDGTPVYIPATYCSDWDGATCWPLEWHETAEEAARSAAGYAEKEAEESREFYAKDAAEQQTAEQRELIHATNKEALALIREIKQAGANFSPAICQALRSKLSDYLETREEAFKRIDELTRDYWSAVTSN